MHKKIMMACMAIAAFAAFVVAPAASASPELTDPIGTTIAPGASVKATTNNITKFTLTKGGGAVECNHSEFKGTVTANTGTTIAGKIPAGAFGGNYTFSGTATGGDCTSPLGAVKPTLISSLCFDTIKGTDNVTIDGCEGKPVTFILDATIGVECKYETNTVLGTFTTNADATISVSEFAVPQEKPINAFCPVEGWLDMDFEITTTDGSTILVS
ncbi:MAG TPA: hypothetical protein VFP21_10755 [Solirubrobacterales bacterium]|nr:hypothetical protein [Solirubrobacterales bacterium]